MTIKPNPNEQQWISFKYSLEYDEAFEAFFLLAARGRKRNRDITAVILFVLAAVLTVLYALYPYRLEYCFLAFLTLITFGGVVYYPRIKAHCGAKKVAGARGVYKVGLSRSGRIRSADGPPLELAGDKDARAFESDAIFVLRPDRRNTFCLPKRAMNNSEIERVRGIVAGHVKKFIQTGSPKS